MSERSPALGFLGGCLAAQEGLGYSNLFHRVLYHRCRTVLDLRLRVHLAEYRRFSECERAVRSLLARRNLDALVFSIRPQAFLALTKLLIKHIDAETKVALAVHPALWRRDHDAWKERLDAPDNRATRTGQRLRKRGLNLMEANLLCGWLASLDAWAIGYVLEQLSSVQGCCSEHDVALVVLGVPSSPETLIGNRHCRSLHVRARAHCRDAGITYVDCFRTLDEDGNPLFKPDGIHFNEHGHRFVADRLFRTLKAFLGSQA